MSTTITETSKEKPMRLVSRNKEEVIKFLEARTIKQGKVIKDCNTIIKNLNSKLIECSKDKEDYSKIAQTVEKEIDGDFLDQVINDNMAIAKLWGFTDIIQARIENPY